MALADLEIEPNNEITEAQPLTIGGGSVGSVTVDGVIGANGSTAFLDVDFYSFQANQGDVVTLDIDGGYGGVKDVDTFLTLYNSVPWVLTTNDDIDGGVVDTGSINTMDSYIGNVTIPATGTYYVAVSSFPVTPGPDGTYSKSQTPGETGDYTLIITLSRAVTEPAPTPGPTPGPVPTPTPDPVVQTDIEIKAGELVRGTKREIFVAVLSSSTFDPRDVDVSSLTFALGNGQAGLKRCSKHGWRINRDKRRDLVCHFSTDVAGVPAGNVEAVLRGKMKNTGQDFEGKGTVKVIDRHADRRGRHRDHDHDRDHRRGRDRDRD